LIVLRVSNKDGSGTGTPYAAALPTLAKSIKRNMNYPPVGVITDLGYMKIADLELLRIATF